MSGHSLIELAERARVYDLAQPFTNGMPQSPFHSRYQLLLARRHGDVVREDGSSSASDLLVLGTHVGTHIDALCHVSQDGRLHGGADAAAMQQTGTFSRLGIETVAPIICRGILLDVAAVRGVEVLPPATVVTADDLAAAATAADVEVHPGDVALIRTGWARIWADTDAFVGIEQGVPGPGIEAAAWLADRGVRATGSDTIAYEARPPAESLAGHPVHRLLLLERGVHILETLQLEEIARDRVHEFLFVSAPLRLVGATGSPLRPLALV